MGITVTIDIWCDDPNCEEWLFGDCSALQTIEREFDVRIRKARTHVKKFGWTRDMDRDYCPSCSKQRGED